MIADLRLGPQLDAHVPRLVLGLAEGRARVPEAWDNDVLGDGHGEVPLYNS